MKGTTLTTVVALFTATALVAACGEPDVELVPTDEEIAIFTEVVLIEAALQDFVGPQSVRLSELYYGQLYDRYGISAADLDRLRRRYDADARLWQVMTDSLEARVTRGQENPGALLNHGDD